MSALIHPTATSVGNEVADMTRNPRTALGLAALAAGLFLLTVLGYLA